MDKRIKTIVPETQQEITAQIERDEDELSVKIRPCNALDEELRAEFKQEVEALDTGTVSVMVKTYRSNRGNELGQDVTVRFDVDDQLKAIDVIQNVLDIGKDYYERQLERNLGREEDNEDSDYHFTGQQKYFTMTL